MNDPLTIKRAFDTALRAFAAAPSFNSASDELGHALHDFYRLWEFHKKPPSSQRARLVAARSSSAGQIASGISWVRKFPTHDLVEVTEPTDTFSRYFTNMFGVLRWKPRLDFTDQDDGAAGRHIDYDQHVSGRVVLDTMNDGFEALMILKP